MKKFENTEAYFIATQFATQLRELALVRGYNAKSIKVLTKGVKVCNKVVRADAMVVWVDGPENWANEIEIKTFEFVWAEPNDMHSISFYNM